MACRQSRKRRGPAADSASDSLCVRGSRRDAEVEFLQQANGAGPWTVGSHHQASSSSHLLTNWHIQPDSIGDDVLCVPIASAEPQSSRTTQDLIDLVRDFCSGSGRLSALEAAMRAGFGKFLLS